MLLVFYSFAVVCSPTVRAIPHKTLSKELVVDRVYTASCDDVFLLVSKTAEHDRAAMREWLQTGNLRPIR
jgi:hypothetical protein